MESAISVLCDVSGESVALEAAVPGQQLHPHLLAEIRNDFPDFSADNYISLNRLLPYINRCLDYPQRIGATDQPAVPFELFPELTAGQRIADRIAEFGGSWLFILMFLGFIGLWIGVNIGWFANRGFDPYPFILLNLLLSCVAALQAPVIMMSQNRQEERDRERARRDYEINLKAESEIRLLQQKIDLLIRVVRTDCGTTLPKEPVA